MAASPCSPPDWIRLVGAGTRCRAPRARRPDNALRRPRPHPPRRWVIRTGDCATQRYRWAWIAAPWTASCGSWGRPLQRCVAPRGRDDLDQPSAALLIRVWLEGAGEFRARLLTLGDTTAGTLAEEVTVAVASSPDDVLDAVRDWIDGFTRQATSLVDSGG